MSTDCPVSQDRRLASRSRTEASAGDGGRTAWGEPDLQGIWTDVHQTPLERPAKFANKEFFTDEERQEFMDGLGRIKYLSEKDPGAFVIRRLTKGEYGNTLHDLFGVDPAIAIRVD